MASSSNSVPGSAQTINYTINSDPSLAPGLAAEPGALCARTDLPGIYCHTGPLDTDWSLMGGCSLQPPFPNPPIVFTIYARTFGSDTTGTGTLANPYRTFQEAVRHINSSSAVAIYIAAGYRFIVDVTDLGAEEFPPGYALPAFHGVGQLDQAVPFETDPWFRLRGAFNIYAVPAFPLGSAGCSPFPLLSAADSTMTCDDIASFVADPVDQLFTLTLKIARPSWATIITGTGDSFAVAASIATLTNTAAAFTAAMVGQQIVIEGATTAANDGTFTVLSFISATQIRYVNTAAVAEAFPGAWTVTIGLLKGAIFRIPGYVNDAGFGGAGDAIVAQNTQTTLVLTVSSASTRPVIRAANAPFELREQSATFQGTSGPVGGSAAFTVLNLDSFAIGGIRFVSLDLADAPRITFGTRGSPSHYALMYCDFGRFAHQSAAPINPIMEVCYFHGGTSMEVHGLSSSFRRTLFDGVTQWSGIPDVGYFYIASGIWQNGAPIGDSQPFGGFQPTPANQNGGGLSIWLSNCRVQNGLSVGIRSNGGGTIARTKVQNCGGDAIQVDRSRGPLRLTQVAGSNNGGIGCNVTNNSVVNIDGGGGAGATLVSVTGSGGDSKCGANAVRTWASYTSSPNENDLAAGGLTSQMCRIYKAP